MYFSYLLCILIEKQCFRFSFVTIFGEYNYYVYICAEMYHVRTISVVNGGGPETMGKFRTNYLTLFEIYRYFCIPVVLNRKLRRYNRFY